MTQIASVIIPTYNHAKYLRDAIDSALSQTVPVEVIVIDDGSTDDTTAILSSYGNRIRVYRVPHGGPAIARNIGIDEATAEFVMFLDADDLIAPSKVEAQVAAFRPEVGFIYSDVKIEDALNPQRRLASLEYGYAELARSSWIGGAVEARNRFPVMGPLVRRSVLVEDPAIRFVATDVVSEGGQAYVRPEDWTFWIRLAHAARGRYLPQVLATYRKGPSGRSRLPKTPAPLSRTIEQPVRLNLGCGQEGKPSWHPIPGLVNLDKSLGWRFEDGLVEFLDGSVDGITVSHALMFVAEADWPFVFSECARVLGHGGVLRITEDETGHPDSRTYQTGWQGSEPGVTLPSASLVRDYLERFGFAVSEQSAETTAYKDRSLCQAWHGAPPDVFFIEGQRPSGVVFAPHADDESLFTAFTIQKYRPHVVVCYPSVRDYGDTAVRHEETRRAVAILNGAAVVQQWDGGDLEAQMRAYDAEHQPSRVWAPALGTSHPDHVAVGRAARAVFGARVTAYHTYRGGKKVRSKQQAPVEAIWIERKLRALAAYTTQLNHPRARQFFLQDLLEFYA